MHLPTAHLASLLLLALTVSACQQTALAPSASLPAQSPAPAPNKPAATPSDLAGLDAIGLDALLGRPTVIRREADAMIWQYHARGCVLDLFLYANAPDKTQRLVHLEARSNDDASPLETGACLAELSDPSRHLTANAD